MSDVELQKLMEQKIEETNQGKAASLEKAVGVDAELKAIQAALGRRITDQLLAKGFDIT